MRLRNERKRRKDIKVEPLILPRRDSRESTTTTTSLLHFLLSSMADDKKSKSAGVWPTVKPFVNGGASGMLATCVIQPIDMVKVLYLLHPLLFLLFLFVFLANGFLHGFCMLHFPFLRMLLRYAVIDVSAFLFLVFFVLLLWSASLR